MPWAHEAEYDALITAAATAHSLDPALVKGLIATESGFDRTAVGDDGASLGLMQVQPATARAVGITGDLTDPRVNLAAGCAYLAQQIARAGDAAGGISAYNGGWRPSIGFGKPLVTTGAYRNQAYVDRVLTHWQYFRAQAAPPANPPVSSGPTDGTSAVLPVIVAGTVAAVVGV